MDKRILKIDVNKLGWHDKPECRCHLSGQDVDGDSISVSLDGVDAQNIISLAQELARRTDGAVGKLSKDIANTVLGAEEHY